MSQGVLGFKDEEVKQDNGMMGLARLPLCLPDMIARHFQVQQRDWTDAQMVLSLILLNIVGEDCVEDLGKVQKNEGFW